MPREDSLLRTALVKRGIQSGKAEDSFTLPISATQFLLRPLTMRPYPSLLRRDLRTQAWLPSTSSGAARSGQETFDGQLAGNRAQRILHRARLEPFKKAYNNYRDDHYQFRQLTQCSGVLELAAGQIVVHLMPRVNYAPRVRRIITELLAELNAKEPVFPDGSGRRLRLRLASRSELRLSIARSD